MQFDYRKVLLVCLSMQIEIKQFWQNCKNDKNHYGDIICCDFQVEELDYKDTRLKTMLDVQDKNSKYQIIQQDKVRKDVEGIKKQLNHERGLKLDAFNRVDELQTHVGCYVICNVSGSPF